MAGALTLGNGTTVTTLVLDGVLADIDATVRKSAIRLNYTGDADLDAIATVTEFVVTELADILDIHYGTQTKTEALLAADASVPGILLPGAISTV